MLAIVTAYHVFSGGTAAQAENKGCESKPLWNNFYVNWKFPVRLSGAVSGLQEGIYPLFILIKLEYL